MLTIPRILDTPEFYDAPLSYKWNSSIEERIDTGTHKITDTIIRLNHKALIGLSTALTEFIYWRLHKFAIKEGIEMTDQFHYVEAVWPGVFDKKYAIYFLDEDSFPGDNEKIEGLTYTIDSYFVSTTKCYLKGSYFTYQFISDMAVVARHIAPNKDWFDEWIGDCLHRAIKLFPAQYDVQEIISERDTYKNMVYDSSNEPPIPREFFFEPGFDYETADIAALNQAYLDNLDTTNPFLNPTEKMIELGFQGTPYKYESK